jgi:hypothetical protein
MSSATEVPVPPAGRYGGGRDDARADRRLRRIGLVCGVLFTALVIGLGAYYILQTKLSGEVISYQVVNDHLVQVHLAVDKDSGASGTCTLRSLGAGQAEVGRVTVPVPAKGHSYDTIVTIRTTARGEDAEVVSCSAS